MSAHISQAEKICESYLVTCPNVRCRYRAVLEHWEVGGACEGMVICPRCAELVHIETGRPMQPCGDCEFCE
jgi:hypothetical protein